MHSKLEQHKFNLSDRRVTIKFAQEIWQFNMNVQDIDNLINIKAVNWKEILK